MLKRIILLLIWTNSLSAQQLPYHPDEEEMTGRYKHARLLDSISRNTVFKSTVRANWSVDGRSFWYANTLKDSVKEYILVDAASGKKRPAFDHAKLAAALEQDPLRLNITRMDIGTKTAMLEAKGKYWEVDLKTYQLIKKDSFPQRVYPDRVFRRSRWQSFSTRGESPDKKWHAFVKEGNVFIRNNETKDTIQYTTNGTKEKPYAELAWSPDSKYVVGYLTNPALDTLVYYVLTSVSGTKRGQLRSQNYKQPGDPFTTYEMHLFPVDQLKSIRVNTEILDFFEAPVLHWRKDDPRYFSYEKVDRGHQRFRIIEVDAQSGTTRTLLDEKAKTFIYESRIFTEYIPATSEIIWSSEKDGWRHLYLVDGLTGNIKNAITQGEWVVRNIDSVDEKKREIWFRASGMHAGEDPYFIHYYRIGFDGKNLVQMTPEKGQHLITLSNDKKYYLDTYSQVNIPPVTELRLTSNGKKIAEIERADATEFFKTGIPPVESFVAKGRDGVTDIWGIICRPSTFDPTKKYPIIENIYAGPHDAFVPKTFMGTFGEMQSMAELGFIVVQIDGMGTANRSKAFHDVCWKNIADAGFPDRILWMKALGTKYPYADTSRVGLYGTSAGGQNALAALLFHPEFYKAAVSSCGCHDNRVDKQWWNEQWMGYPVGKHYDEQSNITNVDKLQGKLLLIVGEADTNVPPESTYRVADALIKCNKGFEFLPIPGMGHSDGGPYGRLRKRNFFVRHLLGVETPLVIK
ncbi:S9 family peptidase [Chitinophaga niabensis]|uniref:Dipeptidyl peptidase IV (DPP IV) N-terminal region n=1 Tax=Chitinophaga niabensis TaxID=536979 RepID=A0A1N6DAY6_9BACT|nr:S9 family peptidase [Chitinophaga niabensis]SIN67824.1 Dipeptidyl peptidase IV (DPP IV) N-terminal region [Chitinophaga niabensis]